jgi:hypothetical protein
VVVVTAYTEASLKDFMAACLGSVVDALEWTTDSTSYDVAYTRTCRALGVSDVADAENLEAIEALATFQVWRAAADALAGMVTHSVDQQSFSLSDLTDKAQAALRRASDDLRQLGINVPAVSVHSLDYGERDPYVPRVLTAPNGVAIAW